jgi:two-component system, OmpR family, response regulator
MKVLAEAVPAASIAVLIVEDSRGMQAALRDLLQTLPGFEVVATVATEERATEWITENRTGWRLALVDLLLQEGSGFNIVRRLRSANPDGHVIVFSEFATAALREKCIALGADAAFLKSDLPAMVRYLEQFGREQDA